MVRKIVACTIALSVVGGVTAQAAPITYGIISIASGSLNGAPFNNDLFTLAAMGDTANITYPFGNGQFPLISNTVTSVQFTIGGVGSGSFIGQFRVFTTDLGFGLGGVFSNDLIDTSAPTSSQYDLATSFGPHATTISVASGGQIDTDQGVLLLRLGPAVTITASLMPEPASYAVVVAGLCAAAGARRRRRITASGG